MQLTVIIIIMSSFIIICNFHIHVIVIAKVKGKVLQYLLSSVESGADPSVQVTFKSSRRYAAITFRLACGHLPSRRTSLSFDQYQVILLGDRDA